MEVLRFAKIPIISFPSSRRAKPNDENKSLMIPIRARISWNAHECEIAKIEKQKD